MTSISLLLICSPLYWYKYKTKSGCTVRRFNTFSRQIETNGRRFAGNMFEFNRCNEMFYEFYPHGFNQQCATTGWDHGLVLTVYSASVCCEIPQIFGYVHVCLRRNCTLSLTTLVLRTPTPYICNYQVTPTQSRIFSTTWADIAHIRCIWLP